MPTGYRYCECRDCFEITLADLCDGCEIHACDNSPDSECSVPHGEE